MNAMFSRLAAAALLLAAVAGAASADIAEPRAGEPLSLDVLSTRITYTSHSDDSSRTALEDIAQLARYPICIENRVDKAKDPEAILAHQVNVDVENMRLGEVIRLILEQEPLFTVKISPDTGTIHVIRKDLVDDPDWLPNRTVASFSRTRTSLLEIVKYLQQELDTEEGGDNLLALITGDPLAHDLWELQFAVDFPGGTLRELLDHVALRMGRVGWTYGYSRWKPDGNIYAVLSVYPATGLPWHRTWMLDTNQPEPFQEEPAK